MYIPKLMSMFTLFVALCLTACFGNSNNNSQDATATTAVDRVTTISEAEFKRLVMDFEANPEEWKYKGKLPSIISFTADWCGPCRRMAPTFDELAREYAGKINIYKVDVDRSRAVANYFGVSGIPLMLFARMNGLPAVQQGMMSKDQLVHAIENFLLKEE